MSGIIPEEGTTPETVETAGASVGLEDLYQLIAAQYVMLQRVYDVNLALLQDRNPEDAERIHQIHANMQTLSPEIRLG